MIKLRSLICEEIQRGLCSRTGLALGDGKVSVEVADNQPSRSLGLMHRQSVPQGTGMLFVFPNIDYHSFWMKNTHVPLSIAFIDSHGVVTNIEDLSPGDMKNKYPSKPVCYALELGRGEFKRLGVRSGDTIRGLPKMAIS